MKEKDILDNLLAVLNEAVAIDREAITELVEQRVLCSEEFAAHPDIVVQATRSAELLGMLGIVNGICKRLTGVVLQAVYDDDGKITHFQPKEEEDGKK